MIDQQDKTTRILTRMNIRITTTDNMIFSSYITKTESLYFLKTEKTQQRCTHSTVYSPIEFILNLSTAVNLDSSFMPVYVAYFMNPTRTIPNNVDNVATLLSIFAINDLLSLDTCYKVFIIFSSPSPHKPIGT